MIRAGAVAHGRDAETPVAVLNDVADEGDEGDALGLALIGQILHLQGEGLLAARLGHRHVGIVLGVRHDRDGEVLGAAPPASPSHDAASIAPRVPIQRGIVIGASPEGGLLSRTAPFPRGCEKGP